MIALTYFKGGHLHEHLKQTTSQQCAVFKSEQDNDPLFKDTLYLATPVSYVFSFFKLTA